MSKKLTKKEMFSEIKGYLVDDSAPDYLLEFVEKEIAILNKRAKTKTQKANETLGEDLFAFLATEPNRLFKVSEICNECFEGAYSTQKISAILRQLVIDEKVEKVIDKRVSLYRYNG